MPTGLPRPGADSRAGDSRQVQAATNSPNLLRWWRLGAAGSRSAPRRLPWTGRGRSGRSPIHEQRLLGAAAGYLRPSASSAGNSR